MLLFKHGVKLMDICPEIVADVKKALTLEFYVVLERDHIHLEVQPEVAV